MEPSYDFSDKSWYKPDGQTQTVRMRKTSVSSATLSTSSNTSPSASPPTSRTGTLGSGQSSNHENRDPKLKFTKLPPPPPVHPKSTRAILKVKDNSACKATSTPTSTSTPTTKQKSKPKSKYHAQAGQPTTPDRGHYYYERLPVPTTPPSSFSSAYSKDSMEKSLLPKRPPPSNSKPSHSHTHKSKSKRGRRSEKTGGGGCGGGGGVSAMTRGISQAAAIYVNELGPKGSWYLPRGTTPTPMRKLKKTKDLEQMEVGQRMESGLVKSWYSAFRRRLGPNA